MHPPCRLDKMIEAFTGGHRTAWARSRSPHAWIHAHICTCLHVHAHMHTAIWIHAYKSMRTCAHMHMSTLWTSGSSVSSFPMWKIVSLTTNWVKPNSENWYWCQFKSSAALWQCTLVHGGLFQWDIYGTSMRYPTQSHYPDTEPNSHFPILLMHNTSREQHL